MALRVIQSMSGVQTSYSEITGYPGNGLTTSCAFPWYNNFSFYTQLRIGVPQQPPTKFAAHGPQY